MAMHHRRTALGLPDAARHTITAGNHGISRFSRKKIPHVRGVSDRAGSIVALR
jgi:hypothetical protein